MNCPRCNSECLNDVNFCQVCGFAFGAAQPQNAYGQPTYQPYPVYYPRQMPGDSEATISFVCGIISLFAGFILGIIAIVMGKKAIQLGCTDSKARTGIILGWISVGITAFLVIIFIFFIVALRASFYHSW